MSINEIFMFDHKHSATHVAPSREIDNIQEIDRKEQLARKSSFAFDLLKSSEEKFSVNTN